MNFNATLIMQMIVFLTLVAFTMKFIWPPLTAAIEERRKKIADGLAASDEADKALEKAQQEASTIINDARSQATDIREQAEKRASQILEDAKTEAVAERERQVNAAEAEINLSANQARETLRGKVAGLVVSGAEKLIGKEIDADRHRDLIDQLIKEI